MDLGRRRRRRSRRARPARGHGRRHRGGPGGPAPGPSRPGDLRRTGQGRGAPRAVADPRRRHRRVRRRAVARPAAQPREDPGPHRHRPHRRDPRHLRPERPLPGGQGPGRAGPAALPAAPTAGQGPGPVAAGRRHRHAGTGRDPARGGPTPAAAPHDPPRGGPQAGLGHAPDPEPVAPAVAPTRGQPRRLHQRRQVDRCSTA